MIATVNVRHSLAEAANKNIRFLLAVKSLDEFLLLDVHTVHLKKVARKLGERRIDKMLDEATKICFKNLRSINRAEAKQLSQDLADKIKAHNERFPPC